MLRPAIAVVAVTALTAFGSAPAFAAVIEEQGSVTTPQAPTPKVESVAAPDTPDQAGAYLAQWHQAGLSGVHSSVVYNAPAASLESGFANHHLDVAPSGVTLYSEAIGQG